MTRFSRLALSILAGTVAVAACRDPEPPAPPPAPVINEDSIAREQARRDSIARAEQMRRDSIANLERMRRDSIAAAEGRRAGLRNSMTATIYFDFDESSIDDQARATLESKLPILNANAGLRIRVAGHTDERGSDEYNLALGQRRAASAKRFLVQRGIAESRIETVSFGEERPAMTGSDESAYAQNRRAEFEIISGADNLMLPQ
ncbi:MAG: peptidoglycan-associated lipoprotein Pal [Gemmatimonadaceae bacterium]